MRFVIFYFSQSITGIIKSTRMKCTEYAQHMGEVRDAYKILVRKPTRNRPLRRPKNRGENSIKMDLRETRCDDVGWIHLVQWPENRSGNLLIR
jgi:hypothetical protein